MNRRMVLGRRSAPPSKFTTKMGAIGEAKLRHDRFVRPALRNQFLSQAKPQVPGPCSGRLVKVLREMALEVAQGDRAHCRHTRWSEECFACHSFPVHAS